MIIQIICYSFINDKKIDVYFSFATIFRVIDQIIITKTHILYKKYKNILEGLNKYINEFISIHTNFYSLIFL